LEERVGFIVETVTEEFRQFFLIELAIIMCNTLLTEKDKEEERNISAAYAIVELICP
jgi:hypothetical protein